MFDVRRVLPFLLLSPLFAACTWMNSDTASVTARDEVLSADEAKGYINMAVAINTQNCPNLEKPGLFLLDSGYRRIFSRPFYYKESLDTCFAAMLMAPCPTSALSDADAPNYYLFILHACNPKPYEL